MTIYYTPTHTVTIDANQLTDLNNVLAVLTLNNDNLIIALQGISIADETAQAMVYTIVSALCLDNQTLVSLSSNIDCLIAQAQPVATSGDIGGLDDE